LPEGENAMPAKPDPKKILDEAMQLEPTTRAFIAETLLESLELDQDFAVSPEWLVSVGGDAQLLDLPVCVAVHPLASITVTK
jgi:hypothetical protein